MSGRRDLDAHARSLTDALAKKGLARAPVSIEGIDVLSNDYLGLRRDERIGRVVAESHAKHGFGAGASRLLGGDFEEHRRLEADLARLQGEEAGVLFASGTAANIGVLTTLLLPGDLVVSDALNHGSIVDGIRLSGARRTIVSHGDVEAVEHALEADAGTGRRFAIVEGIHGMEGDLAPLRDLADVCRRRGALLIVDKAHSLGLLGADGAGAVAAAACEDVVAARVNPCGKALAGAGGVVTCSRAVADLLVHASRALALATALPPSVAAGVSEAVCIAREESWRRERALSLAASVRGRLLAAGLSVRPGDGAIVVWILGTPEAAVSAAGRIRTAGFSCRAVRPPTVPEGTSRIRLSIHADLSDANADRLVSACLAGTGA